MPAAHAAVVLNWLQRARWHGDARPLEALTRELFAVGGTRVASSNE